MFRNLMEDGSVRRERKSVYAVPILKKGNKDTAVNHRPVSLTTSVCKLLEKMIRTQVNE